MNACLSIEKKGQISLAECENEQEYKFQFEEQLPWIKEILHDFGELGLGKRLKIQGTIQKKYISNFGFCLLGEMNYTLGICRTCVVSLDDFEAKIEEGFKFIVLENFSEPQIDYEGEREVYLFDKKKVCSLKDILTEQIILNLTPYPKKI